MVETAYVPVGRLEHREAWTNSFSIDCQIAKFAKWKSWKGKCGWRIVSKPNGQAAQRWKLRQVMQSFD
jgi:hypothetical protein